MYSLSVFIVHPLHITQIIYKTQINEHLKTYGIVV